MAKCDKVCANCKYWGYNCGKAMNSTGDSYCTKMKQKTFALGHCSKNFEEKVDIKIKI